jgi:hypothetical protein
MRMTNLSLVRGLASITLLASIVPATAAQCLLDGAGILRARYNAGATRIFITLSKSITAQDLSATGTKDKWRVEDLSSDPRVVIPVADVIADNPAHLPQFNGLILQINAPLNASHLYRVEALSLTFLGCRPSDADLPTETLLKIKQAPSPSSPPQTTNYFALSKSDGREDSNIYIKTAIEGTRAGDPAFSVDMKYEIPFSLNPDTSSDSSGANASRTVIDIVPYFDLKTSSAENGDSDSLNFGAKFRVPFNISEKNHPALFKWLRYVRWDPGAGFESDRRFRNVNLVLNNRLTFGIPGNKDTFKWRIRLLPFIGYELGRNLRSPVKEAEDRVLSRPYVGSALYLIFDRPNDRSFSIQVDYIRRFLLKREFGFKEMENEAEEIILVPVDIGKGPRDYLKASVEYDFAKFTGFSFSYEYGKLPPLFAQVDHKYGFSLVFKVSTKATP